MDANPNPAPAGNGTDAQPPQPAAAAATTQAPTNEANVDYKARFDGANRKIQELVETQKAKEANYQSTVTSLTEQMQSLRGQFQSTMQERDNALKSVTEFTTKVEATSKEAATYKARLDRMNVIADKHPNLLSYQARGLLREDFDQVDQYEAYLADFDATLQGIQKDALRNNLRGTLPPSVPTRTNAAPDREMLYAQHDAALKARDYELAKQLELQLVNLK